MDKDFDVEERAEEIRKIAEKTDEKSKKQIEDILYYKEFELLKAQDNLWALGEKDIFVVAESENKNGKTVKSYEIYNKEGKLLGSADEKGNVNISEEYMDRLEKLPKQLKEKVGLDKRQMKLDDLTKGKSIKEIDKNTKKEKEYNTEKPEEDITTDKEEKTEKEKIEQMEENLGFDKNSISSSSEIKDKEFYKLVPEAREYNGYVSIVYCKQTNEFKVIGEDTKTGKYQELKTVSSSTAVEPATTIDMKEKDGDVEREALHGVLKLKGNPEYSFATKLDNTGVIEFKELRRDLNTGEYIASEMETTHQYPRNKEIDKIMDRNQNYDVSDEVRKYRKKEIEGKEQVNIKQIKDETKEEEQEDNQKTIHDGHEMGRTQRTYYNN